MSAVFLHLRLINWFNSLKGMLLLCSCLLIMPVILTGCSKLEGTQPITNISYVNNKYPNATGRKDAITITTDTANGFATETISCKVDELYIDVDDETSEEYIYCGLLFAFRPLSKSPIEANEAYRYAVNDYWFDHHYDYYIPDETYNMIKQVILSPNADKAEEILALYP